MCFHLLPSLASSSLLLVGLERSSCKQQLSSGLLIGAGSQMDLVCIGCSWLGLFAVLLRWLSFAWRSWQRWLELIR